jgi:hypothetical protein
MRWAIVIYNNVDIDLRKCALGTTDRSAVSKLLADGLSYELIRSIVHTSNSLNRKTGIFKGKIPGGGLSKMMSS